MRKWNGQIECKVKFCSNVGTVSKNWLRKRNGGQKWVNTKALLITGLEDVQEFSETGGEKYGKFF